MSFGNFALSNGKALPLGASLAGDGVNFAIFSRNATLITLVLFESAEKDSAFVEIPLDARGAKTGDIWHCHVHGLAAGACYLYKADGPYRPEAGMRFNRHKALLDPYAKSIHNTSNWDFGNCCGFDNASKLGDISFCDEENLRDLPRCVVVDDGDFDWQGDAPLNYPLRFSVLYETHVKGLTAHPSSGAKNPGTYLGVIEKIPYFKELGVTSLEFLPIQEFNENELARANPKTGKALTNYWGYSTVAFFAPKESYAVDRSPGGPVNEFKTMVRELHKAGIEVILDVVFNHTGEGNENGPTFSFRGLDNSIYYMLDDNRRYYKNYSGCGNTMNCNHPVVRAFIMRCLSYWVVEMHVDGFRFDLGSILGRDQNGNLMESPPMLESIAEDPVLSSTKIIAEAWDAGGAYQVGWFPGGRWAEWNDRYRDEVRKYWRGDPLQSRHLATRLSGSSDLYLRDGRKPFHSINFVTSHDGFCLWDLVSYNKKRNDENGEENRDGGNHNYSFNCGVEGPAKDPLVNDIRLRQTKNIFATLLVSLGTPMILGGDEFGRTQGGNNNAYCQDNETSWYDWSLLEKNKDLFRFVKEMIAFRLSHPGFMRPEFYTGRGGNYNATPDITWYTEKGVSPDWDNIGYTFALHINGRQADVLRDKDANDFFIMFNSGAEVTTFVIPPANSFKRWFVAVDTGMGAPNDILPEGSEKPLGVPYRYRVKARSMAILISKNVEP
ncbi:MAG: glycogen debranching protein GlgX [Treponema sp.]|nr:glycogen debranching protein GlgX [Treponema sp.]